MRCNNVLTRKSRNVIAMRLLGIKVQLNVRLNCAASCLCLTAAAVRFKHRCIYTPLTFECYFAFLSCLPDKRENNLTHDESGFENIASSNSLSDSHVWFWVAMCWSNAIGWLFFASAKPQMYQIVHHIVCQIVMTLKPFITKKCTDWQVVNRFATRRTDQTN